jgi:hypothetical protein
VRVGDGRGYSTIATGRAGIAGAGRERGRLDLAFAVLAEAVEQHPSGQVTIHGIFDAVYAATFPCPLPLG